MKTIRQEMERRLSRRGLLPDQITTIIETTIESKELQDIQPPWDKPLNDYSPILTDTLWQVVKSHALAWIDDNAPSTWLRPTFEPEPNPIREPVTKSV